MSRITLRSTGIGAAVVAMLMSSSSVLPVSAETARSAKSVAMAMPIDNVIHTEKEVGKKTFVVSKVVIQASPQRLFDMVTDYPNALKYFSNLTSCQVLSSKDGIKTVRFGARASSMMKLDYVLSIDQTKPGRIEWNRVSGSFKANEGYWEFEPVEGGKATLVTYAKYVDAGFFAPKMFVHKTLRDTAENIFSDLKRSATAIQIAENITSKKYLAKPVND